MIVIILNSQYWLLYTDFSKKIKLRNRQVMYKNDAITEVKFKVTSTPALP